jgi:hypothetical protein
VNRFTERPVTGSRVDEGRPENKILRLVSRPLPVPELHQGPQFQMVKYKTREKTAGQTDYPGYPETQPPDGYRNERDVQDKRIGEQRDYQGNENCGLQQLDFKQPDLLVREAVLSFFKESSVNFRIVQGRVRTSGVRCRGSIGLPEVETAPRTENNGIVHLVPTVGTLHTGLYIQ